MTQEEWEAKSDDWHDGWCYAQGAECVSPKDTPDFIDGYRYANEHPVGVCYTVNATTGKHETYQKLNET